MNKQRRGDYGNNPLKEPGNIHAKPHEPKSQSVPGVRTSPMCPSYTPKQISHPFKSQVQKAAPSSKKIPGVPGVKGD